ncbi:hypothetical protein MID13_21615 [Vibrio gigantis]|nr:hypothetical protein [Vibrio gigantis]ULN66181.1 hypothetical protein MID13_21615 [Vibrio gigantis]
MKADVLQETRGIYPFVLVFIHLQASISAVLTVTLVIANVVARGICGGY